jgi:hypothetical protein
MVIKPVKRERGGKLVLSNMMRGNVNRGEYKERM